MTIRDVSFKLEKHVSDLRGEIPLEIVYLDKLEYLDLSNNELIGEIPAWLSDLQNLTISLA